MRRSAPMSMPVTVLVWIISLDFFLEPPGDLRRACELLRRLVAIIVNMRCQKLGEWMRLRPQFSRDD